MTGGQLLDINEPQFPIGRMGITKYPPHVHNVRRKKSSLSEILRILSAHMICSRRVSY